MAMKPGWQKHLLMDRSKVLLNGHKMQPCFLGELVNSFTIPLQSLIPVQGKMSG